MSKIEMKNRFGWPIDPCELREYLDYTEDLKYGIAGIIHFLLKDDEDINRRVQAKQQPPLQMDSPLDGMIRGVLLVIQAALEGRDFAPAGNLSAVRPAAYEGDWLRNWTTAMMQGRGNTPGLFVSGVCGDRPADEMLRNAKGMARFRRPRHVDIC